MLILSGSIVFQKGGLILCNRPLTLRESRLWRPGPLWDGEVRKGRKAGLGGRMGMREVTGSGAPEVLHFFRGAGATAVGTAAAAYNEWPRSAALSLSLRLPSFHLSSSHQRPHSHFRPLSSPSLPSPVLHADPEDVPFPRHKCTSLFCPPHLYSEIETTSWINEYRATAKMPSILTQRSCRSRSRVYKMPSGHNYLLLILLDRWRLPKYQNDWSPDRPKRDRLQARGTDDGCLSC